jgi:O-antigen/teichoic acid export membrane protein
MVGNSGAQLINLGIAPILTRLYTPDDFGLFALFMASVTIGATVASAKYESAILLPSRTHQAWQLVLLCFGLSTLAAALVLVSGLVVHFFFDSNIWGLILSLSGLGIWMTAAILILNSWLTRHKDFSTISKGKLVQAGATGLLAVSMGFLSVPFLNGLLLSALGGQLCGLLYTWSRVWVATKTYHFHRRLMSATAVRYADFPLYALTSEGVAAIARELPNYFIHLFFGNTVLGFYSLAVRVLQLPKLVLSMTMGEVYVQRAAEMIRDRKPLGVFTSQLMVGLLLAAVVCFLPIWFAGSFLFAWVFGASWADTGTIAIYLTPWFIVWFASSPLAYLFYVKRQLHLLLTWQVANLAVRCSFFFGFGESLPYLSFLSAYGWVSAGVEMLLLAMILHLAWQRT